MCLDHRWHFELGPFDLFGQMPGQNTISALGVTQILPIISAWVFLDRANKEIFEVVIICHEQPNMAIAPTSSVGLASFDVDIVGYTDNAIYNASNKVTDVG